MTTLGDDLRRRRDEQHKAALDLLEAVDFNTDPKKQSMFVVGKTTANMLGLLGEVVDFLTAAMKVSQTDDARSKFEAQSNAARTAAARGFATGDWSDFDRVIESLGKVPSDGG